MAKYDQGGGCACGLQRECDCRYGKQSDGSSVGPLVPGVPVDWTVDDAVLARKILTQLGISQDVSMEPGADQRRDRVAAMIRAHLDEMRELDERLTGFAVIAAGLNGQIYENLDPSTQSFYKNKVRDKLAFLIRRDG